MRRLALLFFLFISMAPGCDCIKYYNFTGKVTDSNFTPLGDVQVMMGDALIATTQGDGTYSKTIESVLGYSGAQIKFVKAGYQTAEAEPFTETEASSGMCGSITLRRDAVLQLQQ